MATPTVSIVISVFRRNRFLAGAVRSALSQSFEDIEVIVAEDGGSDCAAEILAGFSDPRLRLCRCERNLGESGNRVHAYRVAGGRYLVNLDDDDALRPQFVESLLQPLEENSALILAFCDHYVMDVDGRIDLAASDDCTRAFARDVLAAGRKDGLADLGLTSGTIALNVAAMFRAELVWPRGRLGPPALPEEAGAADDLYLTYLALVSGRPCYYVPRRLAEYRVHDGQLTALRVPQTSEGTRFCHRSFLRDPRLAPYRAELKLQLAKSTADLGMDLVRAGNGSRARRHFVESLANRPHWRPAAGLALTMLPGLAARRLLRGNHGRPAPACPPLGPGAARADHLSERGAVQAH